MSAGQFERDNGWESCYSDTDQRVHKSMHRSNSMEFIHQKRDPATSQQCPIHLQYMGCLTDFLLHWYWIGWVLGIGRYAKLRCCNQFLDVKKMVFGHCDNQVVCRGRQPTAHLGRLKTSGPKDLHVRNFLLPQWIPRFLPNTEQYRGTEYCETKKWCWFCEGELWQRGQATGLHCCALLSWYHASWKTSIYDWLGGIV